jgi:hypothetical protein
MRKTVILCTVSNCMEVRDEMEAKKTRGELRKPYELVVVKDEDFDKAREMLKVKFDLGEGIWRLNLLEGLDNAGTGEVR